MLNACKYNRQTASRARAQFRGKIGNIVYFPLEGEDARRADEGESK